jgi:hypothetical protein
MVVFSEKFESLHKNYCSLLTTIDVKIIMRKNNYVNILTSLQWHLEVELNLAFFEILRNLKNRLTPLQINGMFQIVFFFSWKQGADKRWNSQCTKDNCHKHSS